MKKKVFAANLVGFRSKWGRKKDFYHKSVKIRFHFIIWCHPKIVTPEAGRPPPHLLPLPLATPLSVIAILFILQIHLPLYCLGYSEKLFRSLRQVANCSLINHTLRSFTLSFSLLTIEYREVNTNLFSLWFAPTDNSVKSSSVSSAAKRFIYPSTANLVNELV